MADYNITVERGKTEGTLKYSGTFELSTKCWWDLVKKIPANSYSGCSATTMAKKKNSAGEPREAIYLANVPGYKGIFVHMGTSSAWSDGCIVIAEAQIKKIYNDVMPKDGRNVTVLIKDV